MTRVVSQRSLLCLRHSCMKTQNALLNSNISKTSSTFSTPCWVRLCYLKTPISYKFPILYRRHRSCSRPKWICGCFPETFCCFGLVPVSCTTDPAANEYCFFLLTRSNITTQLLRRYQFAMTRTASLYATYRMMMPDRWCSNAAISYKQLNCLWNVSNLEEFQLNPSQLISDALQFQFPAFRTSDVSNWSNTYAQIYRIVRSLTSEMGSEQHNN